MSHKGASNEHLPLKIIASLIGVWVALFICGWIGYARLGNGGWDAAFKALQTFHLHFYPQPGFEEPKAGDPPIGWLLQFARFGCALWDILILPAVFWLVFDRRLFQLLAFLVWRHHYVVCGSGSRTLTLVSDLRSKGKRVIWVGRNPDERGAVPSGVVLIDGDSGDTAILTSAVVHRASYLVALHEDDRLNIETLVAADKLCIRRSGKKPPLEAYAQISDTQFKLSLQRLTDGNGRFAGSRIHVHLFNYYELIARLLARRFPIPSTLADVCPPVEHVFLVGFAAFGQCAALRLMLSAQQLYRERGSNGTEWRVAKPKITVVDPCAEARIAEFERYHPEFRQYCDVDFCTLSTTDLSFCDQIFYAEGIHEERRTLVFCIETESETMRVLGLLAHMASDSKRKSSTINRVFCRIARPERLGGVLDQITPMDGTPDVVYFASDAEVFGVGVLLNQRLDFLARKIHEAWQSVEAADRRANNQPTAVGKTWELLSEENRESNREAADHLWAKLRALGYELSEVPEGTVAPPPSGDLVHELRVREEELARAEHARWMTWRILKGWRWGAVRDNEKKLHPDICDYDQLSNATKEKDRINIRVIPELLERGRLVATRVTTNDGAALVDASET